MHLLEAAMELEKYCAEMTCTLSSEETDPTSIYSGIILKAMGIPCFHVHCHFRTARTVGWIAHWSEMHSDGMKIAVPRQLYTG